QKYTFWLHRGRFSPRNRHGHILEPTPKAVSAEGQKRTSHRLFHHFVGALCRDPGWRPRQSGKPSFLRLSTMRSTIGDLLMSLWSRTTNVFAKVFDALERRCPEYVDHERWQQAISETSSAKIRERRILYLDARGPHRLCHAPPDRQQGATGALFVALSRGAAWRSGQARAERTCTSPTRPIGV